MLGWVETGVRDHTGLARSGITDNQDNGEFPDPALLNGAGGLQFRLCCSNRGVDFLKDGAALTTGGGRHGCFLLSQPPHHDCGGREADDSQPYTENPKVGAVQADPRACEPCQHQKHEQSDCNNEVLGHIALPAERGRSGFES